MSSKVDVQIAAAGAEQRRHAVLTARQAQVRAALELAEREVERLRLCRERDADELRRLAGAGPTGMLARLAGDRSQRLVRKRQALAQVQCFHEERQAASAQLSSELAALAAELRELEGADAQHRALLARKERDLLAQAGPVARELQGLAQRLAGSRAADAELDQRARAADAALFALRQVGQSLEQARTRPLDHLLWGGLHRVAGRYRRLQEARHAAHEARRHLRRVRPGLADARDRAAATLELGELPGLAALLSDSLLLGWGTRRRIERARGHVDRAAREARRARSDARRQRRDLQLQIGALERERAERIAQA